MWLSVSLVSRTALTVFGLFFRHIYICVVVSFFGSGTALTVFGLFFRHIYVVVSFFGF